jgi:hypothetical protein
VPVDGAVYKPLDETVAPPAVPLIDQDIAGWLVIAWPNWSRAVAANCWVALCATVALVGAMAILVSVWFTVTLTLLVVVALPSEIVTRKLYTPARVNVAVEFFAALVPLAENVTAAGGVPVVDQV